MPRDKTRPANPQSGTHREKTRPARQNSAVLAFFRSAGRKISRFLRRHSKQGEFYPANHHSPATQRTLPGTKLSGHTACKAATGTKLSPHTACKATTGTKLSQHSKKHPNQPIRGEQGENYPGRDGNNRRRENFIPQTTTHQPRSAHSPVQNSPRTPPHRRPPVQNSPRTAQCACLPQNRMQFPQPPKPTTTQNVGISMIEFQSWKYSSGNCMRNCRASRKTAHKAGPVVIHRPRFACISCISANESDYQARTERS